MTVLEKWAEPQPVMLTIEDFMRLDAAGAFDGYAKTELIGGTIVAMNAQYSLHAHVKGQLFRRLSDACETVLPRHRVWTEVTVAIPPSNLPEPDLLIADFEPSARTAVPVETVRLVVEIADTTLHYDLGRKAQLYAAAGVPEYWVFDVPGEEVHRLWSPDGAGYRERDAMRLGTPVPSVTIERLRIETSRL